MLGPKEIVLGQNKHKVQKSCNFYGLDLAQGKMHMIWITLKKLKEL